MTTATKPRTTRRMCGVGAFVLMGSLVLSACSSAGSEGTTPSDEPASGGIPSGIDPQPLAETTKITINTAARIESFSALFLADEMGEFEKENLEVEFTQIASADALTGLGLDQIQVMGAAPNGSLFNAIDQGVAVKMAIPCYANSVDRWWVRKDKLDQADSLKGTTAASAVGPGGSSILGLDAYLQEVGLGITDVTVKQFPAADVPTALIQGAVDSAYVPEPGARAVEASGVAEPVDTMPKDGGSAQCVYIFGPDLLTERPEVGAAVTRAMARTVRDYLEGDYKANPEVVAALATALDRTEDEITATPSLEFAPDLEFKDDLFTRMQEIWLEVGGILAYDEPIAPEDLIDHRFVDAISG